SPTRWIRSSRDYFDRTAKNRRGGVHRRVRPLPQNINFSANWMTRQSPGVNPLLPLISLVICPKFPELSVTLRPILPTPDIVDAGGPGVARFTWLGRLKASARIWIDWRSRIAKVLDRATLMCTVCGPFRLL